MEWFRQIRRLFGWKNKQFESLTEYKWFDGKIRIWRREPTLEAAITPYRDELNELIEALYGAPMSPKQLIQVIVGNQPNIACIAITDKDGNGVSYGVSYYPDWF